MGSEPGKYYYISETLRNWAIVIGGLFVFFWYGCDLNSARLMREQVDARIKAATEPLVTELAKLDTKLRAAEIERTKAEGEIAELSADYQATPIIRLQPSIVPGTSYKGVREFSLDADISNDGRAPVKLREIALIVSKGFSTVTAADKIDRTQRLWDLERQLGYTPPTNQPVSSNPASEAVPSPDSEYQRLHQDCPHGELFGLYESTDVQWETVERLTSTQPIDANLLPGSAISQIFPFVLTENLDHNYAWYKIELTVRLQDHPEQVFAFVIPTGRQSNPVPYKEEVGYSHTRQIELTSPRKWTTQSPMAPIRVRKRSK